MFDVFKAKLNIKQWFQGLREEVGTRHQERGRGKAKQGGELVER